MRFNAIIFKYIKYNNILYILNIARDGENKKTKKQKNKKTNFWDIYIYINVGVGGESAWDMVKTAK